MVRLIPDNGTGPIQLLGEHETGQLMRKRRIREGPALLRQVQNAGAETERAAKNEAHLCGRVKRMIMKTSR